MTDTRAPAPERTEKVGLLLVDDHAIWRGGVRSLLEDQVEHIIQKHGVSDRVHAAVWAARHGLLKPAPGRRNEE